ncbi:glycosyl hydrolase family 95 catalytic domain-containing protein [Nonomuraea sp. NPDC050790]|uniref:glycosyl hydrolase family 95 catalytic domain-containing protein n=1 Tax=Nonomuraea sp. NPDC050790 TaxID=3364371 RepID=UPI00379BDAAF
MPTDWNEIKRILPHFNGVLTAPPEQVPTDGYPDGPLLGNGDLGAVIGGDRHTQTFHLTKSDLWTSTTAKDCTPIAFGGVTVRKPPGATELETTYRQTTDLLNAEVRSELWINQAQVRMRSFVTGSTSALVTELEADRPVTLELDVWTKADDPRYPAEAGVQDGLLWATRATEHSPGSQWVVRAGVATKLLGAQDVTTRAGGPGRVTARFTVPRGGKVTVISAVAGGRNVSDAGAAARAAGARLDYVVLRRLEREHQDWWSDYWRRSMVRVYDPVVEQFYYGSLYVLGSVSRPGKCAPGLFGWVTTDTPRWKGDYHLNYHAQAPYYGIYAANRGELVQPYFDVLDAFVPTGEHLVKEIKDYPAGEQVSPQFKDAIPASARGMLFPVGVGPWGSIAIDKYHNQPLNASFAAIPYIWQVRYQGDRAFMEQRAYPYLLKLTEFWEDYLGPRGADGLHHFMGSAHEGEWARDDTLSLGLIRMVFATMLEWGRSLNRDAHRWATWRDILAHLPEHPTATFEGRRVYVRDHTHTDLTPVVGRTIVNLEWIHPMDGHRTVDRQVAMDSLDAMNSWSQGNNFPKSFPVAAYSGYPAERLYSLLSGRVGALLRQNLTVAQEGGGIETIGAIETIHAMMLRTAGGVTTIFPNWIAGRPAKFDSLRTDTGLLVSATTDGVTVSGVRIHATRAVTVELASPWPDRSLTVNGVPLTGTSFPARAGETYTVEPVPAITVTDAPASADLGEQGAADWVTWTLTGGERKAGAVPLIGELTRIGSGRTQGLDDAAVTLSWTGEATGTSRSGLLTRSVGNGFRLTVPAGRTPRRLRLYLGASSAAVRLTATLSGADQPAHSVLIDSGAEATTTKLVDLDVTAPQDGAILTIDYVTQTSHTGTTGNAFILAGALS